MNLLIVNISVILSLVFFIGQSEADDNEIYRIGTTTALTGPTKALGLGMVRGMNAHFREINTLGGIHNRLIQFTVLDDGYNPISAKKQMQKLVDQYNVLAVVGNVGTPTAKETVPIALKHEVPLLGVLSGAGILRKKPPDRYVFNYRASYEDEMKAIMNTLLDNGFSVSEIAFFTQNDSFGSSGYEAGLLALNARGFTKTDDMIHVRYSRNTLNVQEALVEIITAKRTPRAIIIVGTYGPAAYFIQLAKKLLPDVLFFNISFVGSHALAKALNGCCSKVYVSQVVPPLDGELQAVMNYKKAICPLKKNCQFDDISFEGYLVASMLTEAMKKVSGNVSREKLIHAFETMGSLDIGIGKNLHFSKMNHQGSHQVWLTKIDGKKVVSSEWGSFR